MNRGSGDQAEELLLDSGLKIAESIHVLHAFQKKSKSGIKTPKPDVDLIEQRLKAVLERHRDNRK